MASLNPHSGVLGRRLAAHLLRRATYAPSKSQIDLFAVKTITQAVDDLFPATLPSYTLAEPIDHKTGQGWINSGVSAQSGDSNLRFYLSGWWLDEAMKDLSIVSKMVFFLHSNFIISNGGGDGSQFYDYLAYLRFFALGNFKQLAYKMTLDNGMSAYLDNRYNNKWNPNENYAREFLELFTIGKGPQIGPGNYTNYTEDDIAAAALVLTGFRYGDRASDIDSTTVRPNYPATGLPANKLDYNRHDTTDKTFSSAFGNTVITGATSATDMYRELEDFVEMVFAQDETARFICRKIYRFFVSPKITSEIESDIIEPLATTFRTSNYDLVMVMKQLLKSQHFYDADDADNSDEIIGALHKSPIELFTNAISYFEMPIPDVSANAKDHYDDYYKRWIQQTFFERQGFQIFRPRTVAGYPAYSDAPTFHRAWFNSSTIISRYKLPQMMLEGKRVLNHGDIGGVSLDVIALFTDTSKFSDPGNATTLVTELLDYVFCESPDADRFDYMLNDVFLNGLTVQSWNDDWQDYLTSGDDSNVKIPLETLVKSVMYSPEYQMF